MLNVKLDDAYCIIENSDVQAKIGPPSDVDD